MSEAKPPAAAMWLLMHLSPRERDHFPFDYLLHEYRNGRSSWWYWRRVIVAIIAARLKELLRNRTAIIFVVLWSLLAPGWNAWVITLGLGFSQKSWQLPWPWSMAVAIGFNFLPGLVFVCAGILIYILGFMAVTQCFKLRRLGRGFFTGLACYGAVSLALFALPMVFPSYFPTLSKFGPTSWITPVSPPYEQKGIYETEKPTIEIDTRTGNAVLLKAHAWKAIDLPNFWRKNTDNTFVLDPLHEIVSTNMNTMIVRLSCFLGMIYALWGIAIRFGERGTRTVAKS
jgi:hypothetical protein